MSSLPPSPPPPIPQRSPKRVTPKRSPLQQRSRSEANEISSRLVRDRRDDPKHVLYSSTPYPTKPAHVLLPSTIRKQRVGNGAENVFPSILSPSSVSTLAPSSSQAERAFVAKTGRAPALNLKRSVATLRDMYEAQAEQSRPSTATSPPLRPTTASSRLRSASSSDGLQGRYAWEALRRISSDDLALLPSLAEAMSTVKKIASDSSFQSRAARNFDPSSPNFVALGNTSSPRIPVYKDLYSPSENSAAFTSSPRAVEESSSSPNIVQLGRSSSIDGSTDQTSSSPNFVKIGSSSPSNATTGISSSSPPEESSSPTPRKRKREDHLSFAARAGASDSYASSPPYDPSVASSSQVGASSPDASVALPSPPYIIQPTDDNENTPKLSSESSTRSLADTHASLQAALSSSPVAPIQYPIVRAPTANAVVGLTIPKRHGRGSGDPESRWQSRLSTVPSELSGGRGSSKRSSFGEDHDDRSDTSSNFTTSRTYLANNPDADSSRVRIVSGIDAEAEHPEALDEVSALPQSEYQYQSQYRPPTAARSSSFLGTFSSSSNSGSRINSIRNSMDNRLNSMKSFTNSHQNSMRSPSQRPGSSSSVISNFQIPTWARRYYSGVYRDSFQCMYSSSHISSGTPPSPPSGRPSTTISRGTERGTRSAKDRILYILRPRQRPRLEAHQSHIEPGVGPLVSNPVRVRSPPPAATHSYESNPLHSLAPSTHQQHRDLEAQTFTSSRPISLHPADPRAHWAGISPSLTHLQHLSQHARAIPPSRQSSLIPRRIRASEWSPHLHLNARSSWRRSRWHAPSLASDGESERWFSFRNAQVLCFLAGFMCPLFWFGGALCRLPPKPDMEAYHEEKEGHPGSTGDLSMDLEARAKRRTVRSKWLRWENTRWWRGLNRFMCVVGVVVVVVVVVLAVLGTRRNWGGQ